MRGVRRAPAARHRPGADPRAAPGGAGAVRRARRRSTRRAPRSCAASCSSSASRCWASATGCRRWSRSLGGRVEGAEAGEFGRTPLVARRRRRAAAVRAAPRAAVLDEPPRRRLRAAARASPPWPRAPGRPVAACESPDRGLYGIQFHPEVVHTPYGTQILDRFLRDLAGLEQRWSPASVIGEQVERVRAQVGDGGVICGLSGGVDSACAAALVHRAVGDQLTCVLVDHGLLRKNEAEQVVETFRDRGIRLDRRGRTGPLPRPPRRRGRAGAQAQDHRRGVHPRVRGGGREAPGRAASWSRERCTRT